MDKNCNCDESINCECQIKDLGTQCIVHITSDLPNLNIKKNTELSTILEKIDEDVIYFKGGIKHKGEWSENISYNKNDVVIYEGNSYISLVNNNSTNPLSSNLWNLMVSKGDQGPKGDQGSTTLLQFFVNNNMNLIMQTESLSSPYDFEINNNGQLIINI